MNNTSNERKCCGSRSESDPCRHCPHLQDFEKWAHFLLPRPEDAQDLINSVMMECWSGQSRFRGEAHQKTWLYQAMRHTCLDWQRRPFKRCEINETSLGEAVPLYMQQQAVRQQILAQEEATARELVQCILSFLSPEQSQLLTWRYLEGYTPAEIAACLGLKSSSVSQALYRALNAARQAAKQMAGSEKGSDKGL